MKFSRILNLVLFMLFFCASLSLAGESDMDKLLDLLLEKGVITQEEAAGFRADVAVKKQAEKEKQKEFAVVAEKLLKLSGYIQNRYQMLEEKNKADGFDIRRARLTLKGDITDRFSYKLQQDFGGGSPKLIDAEIGFNLNPHLKIYAGQFKIPFSQENLLSSAKMDIINRSQVVEALVARGKDVLGNHNGRDIGIMANGSFYKISDTYLIDYALGIFNGAGINVADKNEAKDVVGRLLFHPLKGLAIGGSYYHGGNLFSTSKLIKSKYDRNRIGAEFAFDYKNLSLIGEYITGKDGEYDKDKCTYVPDSKKTSTKKDGYYVQSGFYFIPKKFQVVARLDNFDPDKDVSKNATNVLTIGSTWFFNKCTKIQVNYEYKDEEGKAVTNNTLLAQLQIGY